MKHRLLATSLALAVSSVSSAAETFMVTIKVDTKLKEPSFLADQIALVPSGSTVEILGPGSQTYVRARFGDNEGYLATPSIEVPYGSDIKAKLVALADEAKAIERKAKDQADKQDSEQRWANGLEREKTLIKKYGQNSGKRIANNEAWVGMTAAMAVDSWGTPDDINRTAVSGKETEQWVFMVAGTPRRYLYIENGVVTGIQE